MAIPDVVEAIRNGSLSDAFGVGTAASVIPISHLGVKEEMLALPALESRPLSHRLKNDIDAIRTGQAPDLFGWVHKVKSTLEVGV